MFLKKLTKVPPIFRVTVLLHQAHVDIILLVTSHLELIPNLLAVVQTNVNQNGGNGSKGNAVCNDELGGEEYRRVLLVGGLVELELVVENAADIVEMTFVVERVW